MVAASETALEGYYGNISAMLSFQPSHCAHTLRFGLD